MSRAYIKQETKGPRPHEVTIKNGARDWTTGTIGLVVSTNAEEGPLGREGSRREVWVTLEHGETFTVVVED